MFPLPCEMTVTARRLARRADQQAAKALTPTEDPQDPQSPRKAAGCCERVAVQKHTANNALHAKKLQWVDKPEEHASWARF